MLSVDPVQSLSSGSLGVFSMAGIIIGSLLGLLILVGGGWNLLKLRRQVRCLLFIQYIATIMRGVQRKGEGGESESSGDSSDSDSMELDLANTDLESRLGDTRPPSRARSYRCHLVML